MRIAIAATSTIAAAALAAALAMRGNREPPIEVATAELTRGPIARQVLSTGVLQPARLVDVGAQVSGTIQSLAVDFNSRVGKGEVIARIDPALYQAALIDAQGQLGKAMAEQRHADVTAEDARRKLARAEALARDDLITRADLDAARVAAEQADADQRVAAAAVAAARAAVRQAEVQLERTVIRSPIDGIVINRSIDVGQTVAASFQTPVLFTIADLSEIQLLAEVNESEVAGLEPGTRVRFTVESTGGEVHEGTVSQVRLQPLTAVATTGDNSPAGSSGSSRSGASGSQPAGQTPSGLRSAGTSSTQGGTASSSTAPTSQTESATSRALASAAQPGVVSYVAVIDVPNPDERLQPGGTAIVDLATARRSEVVRIPNAALAFRPPAHVFAALGQEPPDLESLRESVSGAGGRPAIVWTFDGREFTPVAVNVGLADESWTELVSGPLAPGDRLVTNASVR